MKKIVLVILALVWLCAAQSLRQLEGELQSDSVEDLSWLSVQLEELASPNRTEISMVSVSGGFVFRGIPEGTYILHVKNQRGNEIMSQSVNVGVANQPLTVRLPKEKVARPTGETTSIARLRHHPTKQALDHGQKAQRFSESGDYERAATEWKRAVEADPEFSEAHGNLGAQYSRLGRSTEAATEFERAITLDPFTAQHQSNLAVALSQLGRFDDAEVWARRAVQLEGSKVMGHYVLGCVLSANIAKLPEAIQQLQLAAHQIPKAHQRLANIYHALGKQDLAWEEMRQYVEAGVPAAPSQAKSWASPLR